MKIEIGNRLPDHFVSDWPLKYEIFSHYEFACGIPQLVFAVSTNKENGSPNICPQSWSSFSGDRDGYYAVLGGLSKASHTYRNILRERAFCLNFLSPAYYDALMRSVTHNSDDEDEFAACGFTVEPARSVSAPKIAEAFLTLECELHQHLDIAGDNLPLVIGHVLHASMEERYAHGIDDKYSAEGFILNVHSPVDLASGLSAPVGVGTVKVERTL